MNTRILLLLLVTLPVFYCAAQSNEEKARTKGAEAVELMDKKDYEPAIKLLNECVKLQPKTHVYLYELGFAHYLKGDTKKALSYFKKTLETDDVTDQCYQMYGNVLDISGNQPEAMKIYDKGLEQFPESGRLYLEKGNIFLVKKEYNSAINLYEQGIEADPAFPSNYYRAALLYCSSTDEVWGMLYGELFINLEPTSKRTAEISALLYNTYKSEIKLAGEGSSASISFCQNATINISDANDIENIKLPFGTMVYEAGFMPSLVMEKSVDLSSLNRMRTRFLDDYFSKGNNTTYPNALFDYQRKVQEAGHLEAYNYFILRSGNVTDFEAWTEANKEKWGAFVDWYVENPIALSTENRFYRAQY